MMMTPQLLAVVFNYLMMAFQSSVSDNDSPAPGEDTPAPVDDAPAAADC